MYDLDVSPYLIDDCPFVLTEYSENDRIIEEKIKKAESVEELSSIISDVLVRSIKEQLHL